MTSGKKKCLFPSFPPLSRATGCFQHSRKSSSWFPCLFHSWVVALGSLTAYRTTMCTPMPGHPGNQSIPAIPAYPSLQIPSLQRFSLCRRFLFFPLAVLRYLYFCPPSCPTNLEVASPSERKFGRDI